MTKKICSNKNQYLLPFNKGENKLKIFIRAIIAKKFTLIKATSTFILLKSITDQKYTCGEEWYHTKGDFAIAKGWLLSSAYIFTNPQKTIKLNYNLRIKNTINTIILRELSLSVEEPELALISNYNSSSCNRSLILSCSASNSGSSTLKLNSLNILTTSLLLSPFTSSLIFKAAASPLKELTLFLKKFSSLLAEPIAGARSHLSA